MEDTEADARFRVAKSHKRQGNTLYKKGEYVEALARYRQSLVVLDIRDFHRAWHSKVKQLKVQNHVNCATCLYKLVRGFADGRLTFTTFARYNAYNWDLTSVSTLRTAGKV